MGRSTLSDTADERPFDRSELGSLAEGWSGPDVLACPRCETPLDTREIPPDPRVGYVRHRAVLNCPTCGVHGVIDLPDAESSASDAGSEEHR